MRPWREDCIVSAWLFEIINFIYIGFNVKPIVQVPLLFSKQNEGEKIKAIR